MMILKIFSFLWFIPFFICYVIARNISNYFSSKERKRGVIGFWSKIDAKLISMK